MSSNDSNFCRDCPRIEVLEKDFEEMKTTIEKKRDNWESRAFMIIMFLTQALLAIGVFIKK